MTLGGGVCSEVFFTLCPVAVLGHCQEKLLILTLLSEVRAESFSSEQLGRETPRCGSSWAPPWLPEIPELRQCELIYQASMGCLWHGDLLGPSVLQI